MGLVWEAKLEEGSGSARTAILTGRALLSTADIVEAHKENAFLRTLDEKPESITLHWYIAEISQFHTPWQKLPGN